MPTSSRPFWFYYPKNCQWPGSYPCSSYPQSQTSPTAPHSQLTSIWSFPPYYSQVPHSYRIMFSHDLSYLHSDRTQEHKMFWPSQWREFPEVFLLLIYLYMQLSYVIVFTELSKSDTFQTLYFLSSCCDAVWQLDTNCARVNVDRVEM
jgi:hypothetical protein